MPNSRAIITITTKTARKANGLGIWLFIIIFYYAANRRNHPSRTRWARQPTGALKFRNCLCQQNHFGHGALISYEQGSKGLGECQGKFLWDGVLFIKLNKFWWHHNIIKNNKKTTSLLSLVLLCLLPCLTATCFCLISPLMPPSMGCQ